MGRVPCTIAVSPACMKLGTGWAFCIRSRRVCAALHCGIACAAALDLARHGPVLLQSMAMHAGAGRMHVPQ